MSAKKPTEGKSTLVKVLARCRQTTRHYLSQCSPTFCRHMASLGYSEATLSRANTVFKGLIKALILHLFYCLLTQLTQPKKAIEPLHFLHLTDAVVLKSHDVYLITRYDIQPVFNVYVIHTDVQMNLVNRIMSHKAWEDEPANIKAAIQLSTVWSAYGNFSDCNHYDENSEFIRPRPNKPAVRGLLYPYESFPLSQRKCFHV